MTTKILKEFKGCLDEYGLLESPLHPMLVASIFETLEKNGVPESGDTRELIVSLMERTLQIFNQLYNEN